MDILAYAMTNGVSDDEAFDRVFRPRVFSLPKEAAPVAVDSAFGGLGIYSPAALAGAYRGEREVRVTPYNSAELTMTVQLCEHVPFNRRITNDGGRLFIMPSLINYTTPHMDYPPSDCRTIVIRQDAHPPAHQARLTRLPSEKAPPAELSPTSAVVPGRVMTARKAEGLVAGARRAADHRCNSGAAGAGRDRRGVRSFPDGSRAIVECAGRLART